MSYHENHAPPLQCSQACRPTSEASSSCRMLLAWGPDAQRTLVHSFDSVKATVKITCVECKDLPNGLKKVKLKSENHFGCPSGPWLVRPALCHRAKVQAAKGNHSHKHLSQELPVFTFALRKFKQDTSNATHASSACPNLSDAAMLPVHECMHKKSTSQASEEARFVLWGAAATPIPGLPKLSPVRFSSFIQHGQASSPEECNSQ